MVVLGVVELGRRADLRGDRAEAFPGQCFLKQVFRSLGKTKLLGAVGGLIAAWLARSGQEVSVVARGKPLKAIRSSGLRVRERASGETTTVSVKAESDPAKLGPQDYVVVAVKAHSLPEVAQGIGPLVGAETSILTAMNGVPWWFFDRLKFGGGRQRLESLDPDDVQLACIVDLTRRRDLDMR